MDSLINKSENREKWIIDTDPGCDDMITLFYVLSRKEIDVEMISLTEGNTTMDNVCINIKKILKISNRLDVPVYRGCLPIMKGCPNAVFVHMADGLGNVEDLINVNIDDIKITPGYSPLKIIEIIELHPHQINLLMIGPLTNLAIAYLLCPNIVNLIKSIFIMGGTIKSFGNILPSSEFNFSYDYIAPKIILNNFKNIIIVPWDATSPHLIKPDDLVTMRNKFTKENILYNKETFYYVEKLILKITAIREGMIISDLYCAICIFNKSVIKKCLIAKCDSNLDSEIMRGALMVKSISKSITEDTHEQKYFNLNTFGVQLVISQLNDEIIKNEFCKIFLSN